MKRVAVSLVTIALMMVLMSGCGDRAAAGKGSDQAPGSQREQSESGGDGTGASGVKGSAAIVDLAGRSVEIPTGAVKVILGESRMIYSIAPLFGPEGNAFNRIVGWNNDLEQYDPDAYEMYLRRFPQIAEIVNFGSPYQGDFNIEQAIALNADIVIMNLQNLFRAREAGMMEKLEKAGIQTVFVDFRQRPAQHTVPSILLLGQVFQKQAEAGELINFYVTEMQKVYAVAARIDQDEKPLVFIEGAANSGWGDGSLSTWGSNNMGRFVELAGGINYGTTLFGMGRGNVNPEQMFVINPDVIMGTGANWSKAKPTTEAVLLGYEAERADSLERLRGIASRPGWETLRAVKNGRVYSIYHQFYNSPYHFVAIQQMAKWIYPDKFADLDPEKTFIDFHDRFLPISYSGLFWIGLDT